VASAVVAAMAPSAVAAAPGGLSFTGCIAEPSSEPCGAQGFGLNGVTAVAVSPDGKNVYATGYYGREFAVLNRGAGGALSFGSCFTEMSSGSDPAQCSQINGIPNPSAVAVSGDGANVYVLSASDDLATFTRHADGSLTFLNCVGDAGATTGCTKVANGQTLTEGPDNGAILISPDGSHVYVATDDGGGLDGAINLFSRGANGALTSLGCIDNTASPDPSAPCGSTAKGLVGPGSLALGGGYLYAGSYRSIVSFSVGPDESLAALGCVGAQSGCAAATVGYLGSGAHQLALTPDGGHLLAADPANAAVDVFAASGGALTSVGCVKAPASSASCGSSSALLTNPLSIAVSADGQNAYVGDNSDLATFALGASGSLAPQACIAESGSAVSCAATNQGLNGANDIVLVPHGTSLVVASTSGSSVAAFARTPTPPSISITSPGSGATYQQGQAVPASYSCSPAAPATISVCTGTVANGAALDTSTPGTRTFTVQATDSLGQTSSQSVSYSVTAPTGNGPTPVTIAGFAQSHSRWRLGNGLARINEASKAPVGTTFNFTLNEAARITLTFTQSVTGHKVKAVCKPPGKYAKLNCTRPVTVGTVALAGHAGKDTIAFQGRFSGGGKLRPGTYTATIVGSASRAASSKPSSLRFTVVK
jgi:DNA-binding beta-propeller fold protein YncE